jgi:hypothetical protein
MDFSTMKRITKETKEGKREAESGRLSEDSGLFTW